MEIKNKRLQITIIRSPARWWGQRLLEGCIGFFLFMLLSINSLYSFRKFVAQNGAFKQILKSDKFQKLKLSLYPPDRSVHINGTTNSWQAQKRHDKIFPVDVGRSHKKVQYACADPGFHSTVRKLRIQLFYVPNIIEIGSIVLLEITISCAHAQFKIFHLRCEKRLKSRCGPQTPSCKVKNTKYSEQAFRACAEPSFHLKGKHINDPESYIG